MWLSPGPSSAVVTLGVGTLSIGLFGVALWNAGQQPASLCLTLAGGALAALSLARSEGGRVRLRTGAREVAMAIVPWGVIVSPDTEPRVLRWPAVHGVTVDVAHTPGGRAPAVVSSLVTVQTERELLAGRTRGPVGLERLTVDLDAYAGEAARPVAADLEGQEAMGDGATEPVLALLLRNARELCSTAQGAARLALPSGGYRTVATRYASPETVEELRRILASESDAPADPRPLAALIAATLDARALVPELLRLARSPHPVVAVTAKAAALRLGAPRNRAGAVDEVALFLFEEDLELIRRWSEPAGG